MRSTRAPGVDSEAQGLAPKYAEQWDSHRRWGEMLHLFPGLCNQGELRGVCLFVLSVQRARPGLS